MWNEIHKTPIKEQYIFMFFKTVNNHVGMFYMITSMKTYSISSKMYLHFQNWFIFPDCIKTN